MNTRPILPVGRMATVPESRPVIRVGRIERIVATFPVSNEADGTVSKLGYSLRIVENADVLGVPEYILRTDLDSPVVESDDISTCIRVALRNNGFGVFSIRKVEG